ncbi:MAG: hypothetical protein R3Y67_09870 [Eubacteriales bacterium]
MNTPKGFVDDSIITLISNDEVLKKWSECKNLEECYDVVKDMATLPLDEFKSMMSIVAELSKELNNGLLSEADLDAVAGGARATTAAEIAKLLGGNVGWLIL